MQDMLLARRFIWVALLTGQLIFFVVTLVIPHEPIQPELARLLVPITYGVVLVCAAISLSLPMLMKRAASTPQGEQAMRIAQMALLEGPSLLAITGFLITGDRTILGAFAIAFVLLLALFPRRTQS